MRQQINLYQPVLRRRPSLLSAAAIVPITLVFVLALAAVYGYGLWQRAGQRAGLAHLEQRHLQAVAQLEQLAGATGGSIAQGPELERRIAELSREWAAKQALLTALQSGAGGNRRGFGDYLEGLARQRVDGLWLTAVRIDRGGDSLTLSGRSLSPEQVPRLLNRLRDELSFVGKEFRTLSMNRPEDDAQALDFTLSNAPPTP